jgi:hypothetical protein
MIEEVKEKSHKGLGAMIDSALKMKKAMLVLMRAAGQLAVLAVLAVRLSSHQGRSRPEAAVEDMGLDVEIHSCSQCIEGTVDAPANGSDSHRRKWAVQNLGC